MSAELPRRAAVMCATTAYPKPSKPSISDFMEVGGAKQLNKKKFQTLAMKDVNCWQAISEKDEAHSQKMHTKRNDVMDQEDFSALGEILLP